MLKRGHVRNFNLCVPLLNKIPPYNNSLSSNMSKFKGARQRGNRYISATAKTAMKGGQRVVKNVQKIVHILWMTPDYASK